MEGMLPETDKKLSALADLLHSHKGQEIAVLDLRSFNGWTDFFIIATASSKIHIDGLERHIKEFCYDNDIDILGFSHKSADDEWRLIDLGSIIIHLMSSNFREFYDLERLWRPVRDLPPNKD